MEDMKRNMIMQLQIISKEEYHVFLSMENKKTKETILNTIKVLFLHYFYLDIDSVLILFFYLAYITFYIEHPFDITVI